jgi:hypothetical protein
MRRIHMRLGKPLRDHGDPTILAVMGLHAFLTARFALVKMGGGIVGMSGSIAGNTFARNRSGNYVRARTKPVNTNTQAQQDIRGVMSYLTNYWSVTLSTAERTGWATYANAIAMKNRLGESIYLTGFNHFIRSNTEWVNRGPHRGRPNNLASARKRCNFCDCRKRCHTENQHHVCEHRNVGSEFRRGYVYLHGSPPERNPQLLQWPLEIHGQNRRRWNTANQPRSP